MPSREASAMSRGDNPLVRAVGRLPAKVHTKLLIAFVGTAVLVVAVGLLGLRVLGQSNDSVGTLGALQERVLRLRQAPERRRRMFACSWRKTSTRSSTRSTPAAIPTDRGTSASPSTWRSRTCLRGSRPRTLVDSLGFVPPPRRSACLHEIRLTSGRLSTVLEEIDPTGRRRPASLQRPPSQGRAARHRPQPARRRCSPMKRRRRPTT